MKATARPTNQIPTHRTHWKNIPGRVDEGVSVRCVDEGVSMRAWVMVMGDGVNEGVS